MLSSRGLFLVVLFGTGVLNAIAQTASAPAPKRSLTGIWQPTGGTQGMGAQAMPGDGKPGHEPPYTPDGLELLKTHHATRGVYEVLTAQDNDPSHTCDPQGFPRENLFELRATQFLQTPTQMVMLYTFDKIWRSIWTDGRALPKDPDPRWYGYSVGKWTDDYTFVIDTNGMDDRTWIDNAGRPHTEDLRTQEIFHRIDRDNMELSMTIEDPKVYSKPWVAINKMPFKLLPPTTDLPEMVCSPSEMAKYLNRHAGPGSTKSGSAK
ncbi:MAG: hypothetical protein ABL967_09940 [Bryobacteraceae bacterium]